MNPTLWPECPICQSTEGEKIVQIPCGNLDQSTLYSTVRIRSCGSCGHLFNELTAEEFRGLKNYYNLEYAPANVTIVDQTGDRPGSAGSLTTRRYDQLYSALAPHMDPAQKILDVG